MSHPDLRRVESVGDLLRRSLLTFKSNPALFEADRHREVRELSYVEALVEAETLASALASDLQSGGRCAILMSNQSRWVTAACAGLFCGAVLVPVDYKLTADEQLELLIHCRADALIVDYSIYRDLLLVDRADVLSSMLVHVSGAPNGADLGQALPFPEASRRLAEQCPHRPRTRSDLACIVYSSGTSGSAKGCMLTHDNYLEQAQVLARMFPMDESDRYLSVLPTNHAIDFMCGCIVPFLFGAAVVHQRTLRGEFLAPTMKRYRVTHTALVPTILKTIKERVEEQLAELPEWQHTVIRGLIEVNEVATLRTARPRLSRRLLYPVQEKFGGHLRMIFAGGSYIDPALANYFYRIGLPVVIGYGLTEACTVLTVNDLQPFRSSTVGRPVDGVEIEVRDQGVDGIGEVYARGRTVMAGYLDDEEQTAQVLVDGWLRTGDMGRLDASGHLVLVGRRKNMVVTEGGKNVYPEDVEGALEGDDCEEFCVLAESFAWPQLGEMHGGLVVVIRLRVGQVLGEVLDCIRRKNLELREYKRIRSYVVVGDEFPRTASQKVKRPLLAAAIRGLAPQSLLESHSAVRDRN